MLKSIEQKVKHCEEILTLYSEITSESDALMKLIESSIIDKNKKEEINKKFGEVIEKVENVYFLFVIY